MEPKIAEWKLESLWLRISRSLAVWISLAGIAAMCIQLAAFGIDQMTSLYMLIPVLTNLLNLLVDPLARSRLPKPKQAVYYLADVTIGKAKALLGTDSGYLWFEGRLMRFEGIRLSLSIDTRRWNKDQGTWRLSETDSNFSVYIKDRVPCSGRTWSSTDLFADVMDKDIDLAVSESLPPLNPYIQFSPAFKKTLRNILGLTGFLTLVLSAIYFKERTWDELAFALVAVAILGLLVKGTIQDDSKEIRV